jgi:hypothetical protein
VLRVKISSKVNLALAVTALLGLLAYTNCSQVNLVVEPKIVKQSSFAPLCIHPPESIVRKNKIMFIVDKSGSNAGPPGTDPVVGGTTKRVANIQRFLAQHQGEAFTEWSLQVFGVGASGGAAEPLIFDGDKTKPKFGTAAEMAAAITVMNGMPDNGCTPYKAALDLAKSTIILDRQVDKESISSYNVFFLSDGRPNDAQAATGQCGNNAFVMDTPTDPYLLKVKDLLTADKGQIFFHTAYYSPPNDPTLYDPAAGLGLRYMSVAGGGGYNDLEAGGVLNFGAIRVGKSSETWKLKKLMVYNFSSAFCEDGSIGADSDSDGICDTDEVNFNRRYQNELNSFFGGARFDPTNRNSIGAGYSDLFQYRFGIIEQSSNLPACNPVLAADGTFDPDHDMLNSCEEFVLSNEQPKGPTPVWDSRMILRSGNSADPTNPDTDGDGFIDIIEFSQFWLRSAAGTYTNGFLPYTNPTANLLLDEHRHPKRPDTYDPASNYQVKVVETVENDLREKCYDVNLDNLPTYDTKAVGLTQVSGYPQLEHARGENVVMVYYLASKDGDPDALGFMYYYYTKIKKGEKFNFDFSKFKEYKIPAL